MCDDEFYRDGYSDLPLNGLGFRLEALLRSKTHLKDQAVSARLVQTDTYRFHLCSVPC